MWAGASSEPPWQPDPERSLPCAVLMLPSASDTRESVASIRLKTCAAPILRLQLSIASSRAPATFALLLARGASGKGPLAVQSCVALAESGSAAAGRRVEEGRGYDELVCTKSWLGPPGLALPLTVTMLQPVDADD